MTWMEPSTLALVLGGLFGLLVLGILLVLVMRRSGKRLAAGLEPPLFRSLADAHGLQTPDRRTLLALARRDALDPAVFFVSPSTLASALRGPGLPSGAQDLPRRLFGEGSHG